MSALIQKSISRASELISKGILEESELICRQVLKIDSENHDAMCLLSCCLKRMGKDEESRKIMDSILLKSIDNFDFHNSMGISCMHTRDLEQAIFHFEKASDIRQEDSDSRFNKGSCLMIMGKYKEALFEFRESYARSKSQKSMIGMACAKAEVLDIQGGIDLLDFIIRSNPENQEARTNMASFLHLAGRWDEAWRYYPSRLVYHERLSKQINKIGIPLWTSGDPPDGDILVFAEQGIGDAINFGRMAIHLQKKYPSKKIRTLVSPQIKQLLESQGVKTTSDVVGFKSCCSMMDIPGLLNLSPNDVIESFVKMKSLKTCDMSHFSGLFKIGICWAGNPAHSKDKERSFSLSNFKSIHKFKDVKLFSLQKDIRPRIWPDSINPVDLCYGCGDMRIIDMSPHMKSWEDTAAIISSLDLVISADTSVMHLSASLGKDTWGLIPYVPDWRWGLNSDKTCWYPTLKLFRQEKRGDWSGVFSTVCEELERKLGV